MTRGGTPTFLVEFEGVDLSTVSQIFATFRQNSLILTKKINDMTISGSSVSFALTQNDTLKFKGGIAELQFRMLFSNGVIRSTKFIDVDVLPILSNEVIE